MIKRNKVDGTVTLSLADFDELITNREKEITELDELKSKFKEKMIKYTEGLISFVLPFYAEPYDKGVLWLEKNEAIEKIQEAYEHKLKGVQDYTEKSIREKSFFGLIKWKYNKNT